MQLLHLPKKFLAPIANGRYSECCRCIPSTTLPLHIYSGDYQFMFTAFLPPFAIHVLNVLICPTFITSDDDKYSQDWLVLLMVRSMPFKSNHIKLICKMKCMSLMSN